METVAIATEIGFTRGKNFQSNLLRIFSRTNAARPSQRAIAQQAGLTSVRLNQLLNVQTPPNPGIETIEAIAIALEIPVETLLSANPADLDLKIRSKIPNKSA